MSLLTIAPSGASRLPQGMAKKASSQKEKPRDEARAERFRQARLRTGLAQPKAAIDAGVSPSTVTRAEAGLEIEAPNLKKLALFYGVTTDWLMGVDAPDVPAPGEVLHIDDLDPSFLAMRNGKPTIEDVNDALRTYAAITKAGGVFRGATPADAPLKPGQQRHPSIGRRKPTSDE